MLYQALATDYDGTIATEGKVDEVTYSALTSWQQVGNKLILVTGRQLDNLYHVFPEAQSFEGAVMLLPEGVDKYYG